MVELLLIAPLISADKALHRDARCIGQGQQNAAVRLLDAEIDVVLRLEYIADLFEWTVHRRVPDWLTQPMDRAAIN